MTFLKRLAIQVVIGVATLSTPLFSAHASLVSYSYTGQTYDAIAVSPYASSMTITASLNFDLATTTNLSFSDWKADLISYSIFDGVQTLDSSNSTFFAANFATNSLGSITSWNFLLSPGATFNNADGVGFRNSGCYDYVRIDGSSTVACSNQGSGTFTGASVPAPATLALFGLGLAGLRWSRRKKA